MYNTIFLTANFSEFIRKYWHLFMLWLNNLSPTIKSMQPYLETIAPYVLSLILTIFLWIWNTTDVGTIADMASIHKTAIRIRIGLKTLCIIMLGTCTAICIVYLYFFILMRYYKTYLPMADPISGKVIILCFVIGFSLRVIMMVISAVHTSKKESERN